MIETFTGGQCTAWATSRPLLSHTASYQRYTSQSISLSLQASHAEYKEFESQPNKSKDLQNWYLSLPSLTLGINRIGQKLACVMAVIEIENVAPRAGIEPTSLAFHSSAVTITPTTFPDVFTLPINEVTCLRGHCGLLHYRSVRIMWLGVIWGHSAGDLIS